MSINTRKQRAHLYELTFMKWSLEQRIEELEKTSIENTLSIHKFAHKANDQSFKKFCESLSDFETMLEVAEETFPALRSEIDRIKKAKLIVLKKQSLAIKHEEKANKLHEDALNLGEIIKKQEAEGKNSKGLRRLLGK